LGQWLDKANAYIQNLLVKEYTLCPTNQNMTYEEWLPFSIVECIRTGRYETLVIPPQIFGPEHLQLIAQAEKAVAAIRRSKQVLLTRFGEAAQANFASQALLNTSVEAQSPAQVELPTIQELLGRSNLNQGHQISLPNTMPQTPFDVSLASIGPEMSMDLSSINYHSADNFPAYAIPRSLPVNTFDPLFTSTQPYLPDCYLGPSGSSSFSPAMSNSSLPILPINTQFPENTAEEAFADMTLSMFVERPSTPVCYPGQEFDYITPGVSSTPAIVDIPPIGPPPNLFSADLRKQTLRLARKGKAPSSTTRKHVRRRVVVDIPHYNDNYTFGVDDDDCFGPSTRNYTHISPQRLEPCKLFSSDAARAVQRQREWEMIADSQLRHPLLLSPTPKSGEESPFTLLFEEDEQSQLQHTCTMSSMEVTRGLLAF